MDLSASPSQSPTQPKRGRPASPRKPSRDTPPPAITRLGRYRITGPIGRGGMGIVYEAEDTLLQRRVAVKLLPQEVSSNPESLARFLREAQAAARLNHGNVVAVYDIGESGGTHYIVLELMTGGNAQDILRTQGPFHWVEATTILRDVCRGVAAVHKTGLIHRDIKPANILRAADGVVKLGDFGLVKPTGVKGTGLTGLGEVVGTPHYMSPEQCRCDPLDERSDLYSLGATYFALLTGRPPFHSPDSMQVLFAHCAQPAPDPREFVPELPEECSAVVRRAMEKGRSQRYRNASEMLAALEQILAARGVGNGDAVEVTTPPLKWTVPKPAAASGAVSLADAYPAERSASLRKRKALLGSAIAGLTMVVAVLALLLIVNPFRPQPTDGGAATGVAVEDWARLSAEVDRSIVQRNANDMRRALDRVDLLQRRSLPIAEAEREAIRASRVRLEKSLAFRESITQKGFVIGLDGPVTGVVFSPDDGSLAMGQLLGSAGALILDSHTGERRNVVWPSQGGKMTRVVGLAFDRDGKTLAAACTNNIVQLANLETGQQSTVDLGSRVNTTTSVAFSPTSRNLLIGMDPYGEGKGKPYLKLWDAAAAKDPFQFKAEHSARVVTVAFTSGGHQVASGSHDKRVVMWNAETGRIWRELRTGLTIRALACSPNGRLLAVAGQGADGPVVQLWDYAADKMAVEFKSPHGSCQCLAFNRDGSRLASGSGANVLLWNPETHELLGTLAGHGQDVTSVAISAQGGIVASGSSDQTVRLWDATRYLPPSAER